MAEVAPSRSLWCNIHPHTDWHVCTTMTQGLPNTANRLQNMPTCQMCKQPKSNYSCSNNHQITKLAVDLFSVSFTTLITSFFVFSFSLTHTVGVSGPSISLQFEFDNHNIFRSFFEMNYIPYTELTSFLTHTKLSATWTIYISTNIEQAIQREQDREQGREEGIKQLCALLKLHKPLSKGLQPRVKFRDRLIQAWWASVCAPILISSSQTCTST